MATSHDMTTPGSGSTSRLNSARMQQGSTANADRLIAERRAASPAVSHADHYAERAAAREAERQEAEQDAHFSRVTRERHERDETLRPFLLDDPEPYPLGLPNPDNEGFMDAYAEQREWEQRRKLFLDRAEGEELAARIITGKSRPWTR